VSVVLAFVVIVVLNALELVALTLAARSLLRVFRRSDSKVEKKIGVDRFLGVFVEQARFYARAIDPSVPIEVRVGAPIWLMLNNDDSVIELNVFALASESGDDDRGVIARQRSACLSVSVEQIEKLEDASLVADDLASTLVGQLFRVIHSQSSVAAPTPVSHGN